MKKFLLALIVITLSIITIQAASAAIISGRWAPDQTSYLSIQDGETATLTWYAQTPNDDLSVTIFLKQGSQILRVLHDEDYPTDQSYASGTIDLTKSDYLSPGTYTVELYATDDLSFDYTSTITLYVLPAPDNQFTDIAVTANPQTGDAPLAVSFTCLATGGDAPVSYAWQFGDGASSASQNPSHTYVVAGSYTATCTATDVDGDTISGSASVTATTPNQQFTGITVTAVPSAGDAPLTTTLSCTATGGDAPVTYDWDVNNDGVFEVTGATSGDMQHMYTQSGAYTAKCVAHDADDDTIAGTTGIVVKEPTPENQPPVMAPIPHQYVDENTPFFYQLEVSDPDNSRSELTCYDVMLFLKSTMYIPDWITLDPSACTISGTAPNVTTDLDYTIIVGVKDPAGLSDEEQFTLTVLDVPDVPFTGIDVAATPDHGDAPLTVALSCTPHGGIAPYAYNWDFESDGTSDIIGASTGGATHTYASPGTYVATCAVTDDAGHHISGSATVTVTKPDHAITDIKVTANPQTGDAPLAVSFTCIATGGDAPIGYHWSFGDGASSASQNPSHTYATAGVYTATCTATDPDGDQLSGTVKVTASAPAVNHPPVIQPVPDQTIDENTSYTQTFMVSDPDGDDVTCFSAADVGYGIALPAWLHLDKQSCTLSGTAPSVDEDQVFLITVGVKDTHDAVDEAYYYLTVKNVPVANVPPIAAFTWTPKNPTTCDTVAFDAAASSDPDGTIISYSWDLDGDGVFGDATGSAPTATFGTVGNHMVRLKVTDNAGDAKTISHWVTVTACDHPLTGISFTATPDHGDAPLTVSFACAATGGDAPIAYVISFGDGASSQSQQVQHTYDAPGAYTATCTATDADGDVLSDHETITVTAKKQAPTADFTWTPTAPVAQDQIAFDGSASSDSDGTIVSYQWDFNHDGAFDATGMTPTTSFATAGDYPVTLRVKDNDGLTNQITKTVHVASQDHQFTGITVHADPSSGDAPLAVSFTCTATGGDAPIGYHWSFGDGASSASQNPSHTYAIAGVYTATCTATDVDGDTISGSASVTATTSDHPITSISFTATPDHGDAPLTVSFACSATGGDAPLSYLIHFGDGAATHAQNTQHIYDVPGTYVATCDVLDADGDHLQASKTITVTQPFIPLPPIAVAGPDQSVLVGDVVAVDGSASYDPDGGNIVSYMWDFGNGMTASGAQATTAYGAQGTYTVTLTVVDDEGQSATDSLQVMVTQPVEKPECSDGKDNDGDGLIDYPEDPGCYAPNDPKEYNEGGVRNIDASDLRVVSISTYSPAGYEKACAGDIAVVEVELENNAGQDLDGLRVGFSVPEIGVQQKSEQFDLRAGDRIVKTMVIYLPYDVDMGAYYTEITVKSDQVWRALHRELAISC